MTTSVLCIRDTERPARILIEAKTGPFGAVILLCSSWMDTEVMDNELE